MIGGWVVVGYRYDILFSFLGRVSAMRILGIDKIFTGHWIFGWFLLLQVVSEKITNRVKCKEKCTIPMPSAFSIAATVKITPNMAISSANSHHVQQQALVKSVISIKSTYQNCSNLPLPSYFALQYPPAVALTTPVLLFVPSLQIPGLLVVSPLSCELLLALLLRGLIW